ncbi:class I SAM-dependent methyltransferase [Rhizobium sp. TH2]|uniref:SAM-dependent methyltransferase n=1 Tax=Rhizobium sp. TH2 TaxID=2775403 RepID=UPI00215775E9|nr:class I SAM-dependent methyltransferase [Rhizobium sp. TH2]UVC07814.1 class I SAM-dependent methyltransferase [Rhizobium sp. TH2]
MAATVISPRLLAIVDALPLRPGIRVLEIGCGPGAMAREIAARIGNGHVLAIDRSAKAIALAIAGSDAEISPGTLEFRKSTAETFTLRPGEQPYDLAVAVRVGALDGRHPEAGILARAAIKAALVPGGKLFIDGGDPVREVVL